MAGGNVGLKRSIIRTGVNFNFDKEKTTLGVKLKQWHGKSEVLYFWPDMIYLQFQAFQKLS